MGSLFYAHEQALNDVAMNQGRGSIPCRGRPVSPQNP